MRISEAVMLKNEDFDWKNGMIVVRNIKRMAMRLVPLDPSAIAELRSYKKFRDAFYPKVATDRFFFLDKGKPITAVGVWYRWRFIWEKIDKTKIVAQKCPRLHDLRHTFACDHLLDAYRKKKDIDRELYVLSVYLGHVKVSSTYWYLTDTPELLEHVGKAFEKHVGQTRKKLP
jgi:integrase